MILKTISMKKSRFFIVFGRGGPSCNAGKSDHWSGTHGGEGGPRRPLSIPTMVEIDRGLRTVVAQRGAARILNTVRLWGLCGGPAGPPPGRYSRSHFFFSRKSPERGCIMRPRKKCWALKQSDPRNTQVSGTLSPLKQTKKNPFLPFLPFLPFP